MTPEQIILTSICGLGIFLFGINLMSNALKKLAGAKMKTILEKTTNTPIKGVLIGFLITALIQSSSGTTAIVVSLITAGLLPLPQAMAIIIGANIGTTTTSILVGLDLGATSPIFILLGSLMIFFFKRKNITRTGEAILGFGFLFYGLDLLGSGLGALTEYDWFLQVLNTLSSNSFITLFTGFAMTGIIQSSSATIGILQTLYSVEGSTISLSIAIAFMLGANLGTTITGLIASISGSRDAKRATLFHILFNLIGIIIFMSILDPFAQGIMFIADNVLHIGNNPASIIALANFSFNLIVCLLVVWFIPLFVKLIIKIIPYSEKEKLIDPSDRLNESLILNAPGLAIESARQIILQMSTFALSMFENVKEYILTNNVKCAENVRYHESLLDSYESKIHDYLTKLVTSSLNNTLAEEHTICLDTIRDFERIGDHCVNIIEFMEERYRQGISFNQVTLDNVTKMTTTLSEMLISADKCFKTNDISEAQNILKLEPTIDALEKSTRQLEISLIADGSIKYNDIDFVDILANLERIGDHCTNIAENIAFHSLHEKIIKD